MIVPDVNLLVYAHFSGTPQHHAARQWWEGLMNGRMPVGLPTVSIFGFLRLTTNPRVFDSPMEVEEAVAAVEKWVGRPHVRVLLPGARHLELAFGLMRKLGAGANLTTDIQLASLAMEHQAELHSNDQDFGRFDGLRWVNPLKSPKA